MPSKEDCFTTSRQWFILGTKGLLRRDSSTASTEWLRIVPERPSRVEIVMWGFIAKVFVFLGNVHILSPASASKVAVVWLHAAVSSDTRMASLKSSFSRSIGLLVGL